MQISPKYLGILLFICVVSPHEFKTMKSKILGLSLIVICLSCAKKDPPTPPLGGSSCVPVTRTITDARIIACEYKPGSYWVVKDSLSGAIDTLSVDQLQSGTTEVPNQGCDIVPCVNTNVSFKHPSIGIFRSFTFMAFMDDVAFLNVNSASGPPDSLSTYGAHAKYHDSLKVNNLFYKAVGESRNLRFKQDANTNTFIPQTIQVFFTSTDGPLQFDYRDLNTGALLSRQQVIGKNIVR